MNDQYAINMRFAEEIFRFLWIRFNSLYEHKDLWLPKFEIPDLVKKTDAPAFHDDVGWSVLCIIENNIRDIEDCYCEFIKDMREFGPMNDVCDAYFTRNALNIAPFFFKEGYSHESFLAYCAMVLGVAYNFLFLEPNRIPHRACHVVGLVLFLHQMTGEFHEKGGWKGLHDLCSNFNDCQERKGNLKNIHTVVSMTMNP